MIIYFHRFRLEAYEVYGSNGRRMVTLSCIQNRRMVTLSCIQNRRMVALSCIQIRIGCKSLFRFLTFRIGFYAIENLENNVFVDF